MNEITKELLDALRDAEEALSHVENNLHVRVNPPTLGKMREAIAKAEAALAAPQPSADGWIPWKGGDCPVAHGTVVDVRLRNGWEGDLLASVWRWHHATQKSSDVKELDIIAYRVVNCTGKYAPHLCRGFLGI